MVEILVVIRPNKLQETKKKLIETGYPAYTCQKAEGRGKEPVNMPLSDGSTIKTKLVNKRVLNIMVPDEAQEDVVDAIMEANSTGNHGDGKIFICPVEKSYKVRTYGMTKDI